jgi:hypothetical protein
MPQSVTRKRLEKGWQPYGDPPNPPPVEFPEQRKEKEVRPSEPPKPAEEHETTAG